MVGVHGCSYPRLLWCNNNTLVFAHGRIIIGTIQKKSRCCSSACDYREESLLCLRLPHRDKTFKSDLKGEYVRTEYCTIINRSTLEMWHVALLLLCTSTRALTWIPCSRSTRYYSNLWNYHFRKCVSYCCRRREVITRLIGRSSLVE
jgi:hypothetical protein